MSSFRKDVVRGVKRIVRRIHVSAYYMNGLLLFIEMKQKKKLKKIKMADSKKPHFPAQ